MTKPRLWLGAISAFALAVMVAVTLRVGRPISDDYCGYIAVNGTGLFDFTFSTYRDLMANVVGFGLYEMFSWLGLAVTPHLSLAIYFILTALLVALAAKVVLDLVKRGPSQTSFAVTASLVLALSVAFYLGLSLPSPTGNVSMLSLMTLTTTTGIFHIWPVLAGIALIGWVWLKPQEVLSPWKFIAVTGLSAAVALLGHAESIAYLAVVGITWLFVLTRSGFKGWLGIDRVTSLLLGAVAGFIVIALNPGSKSPFAVLRAGQLPPNGNVIADQSPTSLSGFVVYFASYAQDVLGRGLGNGVLLLVALIGLCIGLLFAKDLLAPRGWAVLISAVGAATLVLLVVTALGEYFGYPAWYHEVGLFMIFVVTFTLLGLFIGACLGARGHQSDDGPATTNRNPFKNVLAVLGFAGLVGLGVATYLSRVEYLQDRAVRWDAGLFTTIVHPQDGTLILPDGDSGITWVAECAKSFADLRGLTFENYLPPVGG